MITNEINEITVWLDQLEYEGQDVSSFRILCSYNYFCNVMFYNVMFYNVKDRRAINRIGTIMLGSGDGWEYSYYTSLYSDMYTFYLYDFAQGDGKRMGIRDGDGPEYYGI